MPIRIYDSLAKKKVDFIPAEEKKAKIYSCGVTVYDECHIGHARSLYIFDVIRKYLKYRNYEVTFVRNITDIDDKIINKAKELGISASEVAQNNIESYYRDLQALGIPKADFEPRATENIPDMVKHIQALVEKGFAYAVEGDVYFSVRKFPGYGKLSGQSIEQMQEAVRIEKDPKKKDPLDFALWKKSQEDEPNWDSPWGKGRPGWHIECSVMSSKYLNTETLDIHAGGRDLIFPHHENEIAQSEALTGKPFAKYWIHHGLLTINGQKMAKSVGNFVTIKEILNHHHPDVLKMFYLEAHYASPVDFSWNRMEESKKRYKSFVNLVGNYNDFKPIIETNLIPLTPTEKREIDEFRIRFEQAMDDDFNTPKALSVFEQLKSYAFSLVVNDGTERNSHKIDYALKTLFELTNVLGLSLETSDVLDKRLATDSGLKDAILDAYVDTKEIQKQVEERTQLKKERKFEEADKIRKELEQKGIVLEDMKDGTTKWRWK